MQANIGVFSSSYQLSVKKKVMIQVLTFCSQANFNEQRHLLVYSYKLVCMHTLISYVCMHINCMCWVVIVVLCCVV